MAIAVCNDNSSDSIERVGAKQHQVFDLNLQKRKSEHEISVELPNLPMQLSQTIQSDKIFLQITPALFVKRRNHAGDGGPPIEQ